MKLRSLRIQNYKVFEDANFVPAGNGVTVVIGLNGSGKTSLWEVLSLLPSLAAGWQIDWLRTQLAARGRSFIGCLPWRRTDLELKLAIEMEFKGHQIAYQVGWKAHPETGDPQLSEERATLDGQDVLRFDRSTGRYGLTPLASFPLEKDYPVLMSSMGRRALAYTQHAVLKQAFDEIERWGTHRFRVLDLGKNFQDLDITAGPRDRLTRTGSNLSVVLHAWKDAVDRESRDRFVDLKRLTRVMLNRAGLENIDWDVHTEVLGGSVLAFVRFHREDIRTGEKRWFDFAYGPDGFRAFLLLMVALLTRSPLLAIEEPENHLEPRILDLVADQMLAAAQDGTQVVVTTHSPHFATMMPPESIRVLRGGRFEGVPPSVAANKRVLDAWLSDLLHEPAR